MSKLARWIACGLVLVCILLPHESSAQTSLTPAVNLASAPMLSPTAAWTYYSQFSTVHTSGAAAWTTNPPEIVALARSLGAGQASISAVQYSQNVFDYIRNNISAEFRFGLGKGGRGALIDQSGTPFDQSELMVKLLRQGNVTANYQVGTITITAQQFGQWTGLVNNLNSGSQTFSVDATAACQFLADGGIPASVNGSSDCTSLSGTLTSVTMGHIWVSANGFLYDPSFKRDSLTSGIDLAAGMGCGSASAPTCGSQLQTSALSASSSGNLITNVPYLQNLNETAALSTMDGFARTLQTTLTGLNTSIHDQFNLDSIVGGATIDPSYSPQAGAALPYGAAVQYTWTGDIPDGFRTTATINGCLTKSFFADELAGRRLRNFRTNINGTTFTYSLYADDVDTGDCQQAGTQPISSISIHHPYAASAGQYAAETIPIVDTSFEAKTIVIQLGEASQSTTNFFADIQNADPSPFVGGVGTTALCNDVNAVNMCRADDDPITAASIVAQQSAIVHLASTIVNTAIRHHHRFGIVHTLPGTQGGKAGSNGASILVNLGSSISVNGNSSLTVNSYPFEMAAHLSSMIEGSVTQQTLNTWEPLSGSLSFILSNRSSRQILYVPPASMSAVIPLLTNYAVGTGVTGTDVLQNLSNAGYFSIIPQDASFSCFYFPQQNTYSDYCTQVNIKWHPDYEYGASSIALLNNESLKGGGSVSIPDPSSDSMKSLQQMKDYSDRARSRGTVDKAMGHVTLTPQPDLVTGDGEFPKSLPLQRSYSSGGTVGETYYNVSNVGSQSSLSQGYVWNYHGPDTDSAAHIGGGWVHNYQITARLSNNPWTALGQDSALDASALIAGIYTLNSLMTAGTFQSRTSALFVDYWMSRQFLDDVADISRGASVSEFKRLPDGSFNPPPGTADILVQTGAKVPLLNGGNSPDYDYTAVTFSLTDKVGAVTQFDWSRRTFPYGDNTTASYDPNPFSGDAIGRPFTVPEFKANAINFPDGSSVNLVYTMSAMEAAQYKYVLQSVTNSYGRSLTFSNVSSDPGGNPYPDVGWKITTVTDDNGRQVAYNLSNCGQFLSNNGGGQPSGSHFLACPLLNVTLPDGSVDKYDYTPGSDSPDPVLVTRPRYRIRRWYTPGNLSTPFQVAAYDPLYRVGTLTDILGHATQYFPSASFTTELWKRTNIIDPLGNISSDWFDKFNDNTQIVDPIGKTTIIAYNLSRQVTNTTKPEGDSVSVSYDVRSNVLQTTRNPKPGSLLNAIVSSAIYGESATTWLCANPATCNLPTSTTDGRGNTTNYSWNSTTGQLAQILKPADSNGLRPETDLAYTAYSAGGASLSLLTQKTDKISTSQSLVTSFAYNASNKYVLQSATVDPSGLALKTSFTLDSIGNLTQMVGPRTDVLNQSNYTWDANRRLLMTIEANPGTGVRPATRYIYDLDGELIETDKGTTTSSTGSDFAAVETTLAVYDGAGNKIQDTVLNGTATPALAITQTSYDADDRELCTAVRMNPAVYGTLPSSACTLSTAGSNGPDRITQLSYDAAGHKLVETRAYGTSLQQAYATYQYTPNGQQSQVADANGNLTAMTYDGFDRLSQLTFPSPTTAGQVNANDYESYSYDANGNRVSVRKRSGDLIAYTYDALNREILKAVPGSGAANVYSSYDLLGHKLAATFGSVGGAGVNYTYDVAGRLTGEASNGLALGYAYDQAGNRTMIAWPDGLYVTYTYDPLNRMSAVNENGATQIASYSYDALGRRSGLSRSNGTSTSWTYDNADRLASLGQTLTPAANDLTLQFGYLPSSQIATRTASNDNYTWAGIAATTSYTPNGLNQYASVGGTSFTYDAKANLISDGARTFTYDVENRLLTASAPTPLTLTYDPPGRLQSSTASGATTQFLYAGDALVGEYNGSTPLRRYVPGPGEDEPVLWYEGPNFSNRNFLHTDNQGSIIAWTNATGTGGTFQYGPYGEPSGWTGSRYRYTGQIMIPEANLYHYKARVYDPGLGRFLQTDPIGYKDNLDLYAYVGDDPTDHSDTSGMLVDADYNYHTSTLTIRDSDTGRTVSVQADSGGKPPPGYIWGSAAPIPNGRYDMLEQGQISNFIRLEPLDSHYGNDRIDGGASDGRNDLRIHPPGHGYTVGCISICDDSAATDALGLIKGTKTTEAQVEKKGLGGLLGETEIVKKYGTLTVTGVPQPRDPNQTPSGQHHGDWCNANPWSCSIGNIIP